MGRDAMGQDGERPRGGSGSGDPAGRASGNPRVGISLVCCKTARDVEALGEETSVELAYTMDGQFLRDVGFLAGRVLSAHAPCPAAEYLPNLGSRDPGVTAESLETIRRSAATAASFGGRTVVLHPGYVTDERVPTDSPRRLSGLAAARDDGALDPRFPGGTVCRPEYCSSPAYADHRRRTTGLLVEAARICGAEGTVLAVENLNPRLRYLFQLPREFAELASAVADIRFCVDIGHLWISSLLHGFDFLEGLQEILSTGRVVTAHIHDNSSLMGHAPHLADDHGAVGTGRVAIRAAVEAMAGAGVPCLVIESTAAPLEGLRRVRAMLAAGMGQGAGADDRGFAAPLEHRRRSR